MNTAIFNDFSVSDLMEEEKYNEECKSEEYKGLKMYKPANLLFKNNFFKKNPKANEEDFNYIYTKKKHVKYIDIDKLQEYIPPNGECIGKTLLEKRKMYTKNVSAYYQYNENKKPITIYDTLSTTPIGFIPIEDNKYIIVTRRKITIIDMLMPLFFIRILILLLLGY